MNLPQTLQHIATGSMFIASAVCAKEEENERTMQEIGERLLEEAWAECKLPKQGSITKEQAAAYTKSVANVVLRYLNTN